MKTVSLYILGIVLTLLSLSSKSQITVSGGTGLAASYTSFTNAGGLFAALNSISQTGRTLTVTITGNIVNESGTNSLNAGAWNEIDIFPSGARTVSGLRDGGPLINFNGADYVVINGLNSGGNSLIISNTSTSSTANTSTIRFIADARVNSISNSTILGSGTTATTTPGGTIFYSTATANGNNEDFINNCNIGPAGTNLPTKAVYGSGSTSSAFIINSNNIISNCNIYDYFSSTQNSAGIYIADGCNYWGIIQNRFYQTAPRTITAGITHSVINVNSATAVQGAQGFNIDHNTIGYASSSGTGVYTLTSTSANAKFIGIRFNGITNPVGYSTVDNNTISAINVAGLFTGTGSASPFMLINIESGFTHADNNIIGSQSATQSIAFSNTNVASGSDAYIMRNVSADNWITSNNIIGGINASSDVSADLYIIAANNSGTKTWTASGNTIGGVVTNSIQAGGNGNNHVIGLSAGIPGVNLTSNIIRNLNCTRGNGSIISDPSVAGISVKSTTLNNTVSQNTIYFLSNTSASQYSAVTGIFFTGASANTVSRNKIYNLQVSTTDLTSEVDGVFIAGGSTTYSNNMIAIGDSVSTAINLNGIREHTSAGNDNFYHNSIYLEGSPSSGTSSSFAFNSAVVSNTRNIVNNIFVNARNNIGSASGKNYALTLGGTTGLACNYNIYHVTGNDGKIGFFNNADVNTFSDWQLATGKDANSIDYDPRFADTSIGIPDLHIGNNPSPAEGKGTPVPAITTDFDGQTRSGLTPVDIGADAGNFSSLTNMSYVSSSVYQQPTYICPGTQTVILRIDVTVSGELNPLSLAGITINANGTNFISEISSYQIFYTGTNAVFNNSTPIAPAAPNGGLTSPNIEVIPNQTITFTAGTNYFWLVYNIPSPPSGFYVNFDGECTYVRLSSGGGVPQPSAPPGVMHIPSPGTSSYFTLHMCPGQTTTLISNAEIAGEWSSNDQSVATVDAITGKVTAVSPGSVYIFYTIHMPCGYSAFSSSPLAVYPNISITATAGPGGTISPGGTIQVCGAGNFTYNIHPNPGYVISDVTINGNSIGPSSGFQISLLTSNTIITASFVPVIYTIASSAGLNGSISPAGSTAIISGSSQTYTITPAPGYMVSNVMVDGANVGAVTSYTFTDVIEDHTISAIFVIQTYNITATAGTNGSISPPGITQFLTGASQTYSITPASQYLISDVLVDGISVGAVTSYTFTNITVDHTISASFRIKTYTITASIGQLGIITPNGITTVNANSNQAYAIGVAFPCVRIANVIVDGISFGVVTSYTFTNVTANHTINVVIESTPMQTFMSGPINVCSYIGTGVTVPYSFNSIAGANYDIVCPPEPYVTVLFRSGNNIILRFNAGFASQPNKQIRVRPHTICSSFYPEEIFYLAAQAPSTPEPISGNTNICTTAGMSGIENYRIQRTAGASEYIWSFQNNSATIVSANGTGVNDTSANLNWSSFVPGLIKVRAVNGCGTSSERSLSLVAKTMGQPGLINGPTNVCPNIAPNGTAANYTVAPLTGAINYTWTVPSGAIGLSGQGTNSISFTYPQGFTSGAVKVGANNGCSDGLLRNQAVQKLNVGTPSQIDVIALYSCPGRVYTYTLASMPSNSTFLRWTIPAQGTLISGQGTTSISVSYPAGAINGNVTVKAISNCDSSGTRSTEVKLAACASGSRSISSKGNVPVSKLNIPLSNGVVPLQPAEMEINISPNPTTTNFKLQVNTSSTEIIIVRILDLQGRLLKTLNVPANEFVNFGNDLKAGVYMIEVRQGEQVKTSRLIKF